MAISVDTVYQRVLALANKEQRGYITPQEFNLIAQQAQMEIFEQYFYDAKSEDKNLKNSTEFSNIDEILDEKISIFKATAPIATNGSIGDLPSDLYRLGMVFQSGSMIEVEQVNEEEVSYLLQSPLAKPTNSFPAFHRLSQSQIKLHPIQLNVSCNYIRTPKIPKWSYVVVNEKALYNASAPDKQDFEIHVSDSAELVYKILSLAGIVIAKPGLGSYADAQINAQKQQEKQ
tara:strand:- start:31647 stop:32339 length:693 start_codon:yes stop_codon:yes gene_type:complete